MSTPVTNPLTYNGYVAQIGVMAVLETQDSGGVTVGVNDYFNTLIPQMLNYSELRIQRDLDLLPALTSRNYSTIASNPILTLPIDDFVTISTMTVNDSGNITPLLPVSREFIQNVFLGGDNGVPQYFAMYGGDLATFGDTSNLIYLGPTPDAIYQMVVTGMIRLQSLYYYANPTDAGARNTFISAYLPDLLIQASMIYISQFQRNFGAASNDPEMGPTYELNYKSLLAGAMVEEARKRFMAGGWTSYAPAAVASPGR